MDKVDICSYHFKQILLTCSIYYQLDKFDEFLNSLTIVVLMPEATVCYYSQRNLVRWLFYMLIAHNQIKCFAAIWSTAYMYAFGIIF